MSKNIQTGKKLLIVSDTAMYKSSDGIYAFGPVVLEVEHFLSIFEAVTWIGFERKNEKRDPIFKKVPGEVKIIMLPKSGGDSLLNKLNVVLAAPEMIIKILRNFKGQQVIHTRAPSSPAFLATLLSFFFKEKIYWHKYAGNWGAEHPSFFYGLQIKLLKSVKFAKITINGRWPSQPRQCLSFENPCLDEKDIEDGAKILPKRAYNPPFTFCFAGRLEDPKGVGIIIRTLAMLDTSIVKEMHFAGNGPDKQKFKEAANFLQIPVIFHGNLSRKALFELYKISDFLLLPTTAAEGFPKVLAEAANFGCIPITTGISSITQYIRNGENGYILTEPNENSLLGLLKETIKSNQELKKMALESWQMGHLFTYSRYLDRIQNEIILDVRNP